MKVDRQRELDVELVLVKTLFSGNKDQQAYIIKQIPVESISYIPDLWKEVSDIVLKESKVSLNTIRLKLADSLDALQLGYLESLEHVPTCESIQDLTELVSLVKEKYHHQIVLANLSSPYKEIEDKTCNSETGLGKVISVAHETLAKIANIDSNFSFGVGYDSKEILQRFKEKPLKIYKTGFYNFDRICGGFGETELVIVAAPPSSGKSLIMQQLALNMSLRGVPCCYDSLELTPQQIYARIVSNRCSIDSMELRDVSKVSKENWKKIEVGVEEFTNELKAVNSRLEIPVVKNTTFDIQDIIYQITVLGCKVIFIDDLDKMIRAKPTEKYILFGEKCKQLKDLAKDYSATIVTAAQLDKKTLEVKYSRALEAHTDFLITWSFDRDDLKKQEDGILDVPFNIEKGRSSAIGNFDLRGEFKHQRWTDTPNVEGESEVVEAMGKAKINRSVAVNDDEDMV